MSRRYGRCRACRNVVRLRGELVAGWHPVGRHRRRIVVECAGVGASPVEVTR